MEGFTKSGTFISQVAAAALPAVQGSTGGLAAQRTNISGGVGARAALHAALHAHAAAAAAGWAAAWRFWPMACTAVPAGDSGRGQVSDPAKPTGNQSIHQNYSLPPDASGVTTTTSCSSSSHVGPVTTHPASTATSAEHDRLRPSSVPEAHMPLC